MKLELNVPSSQVAAIETIIKVICSNETGKQLSVEDCLDDSKMMGFISGEFVKRIVLWSKKVDSLAKMKAKNKSSELLKLKELAKDSKTENKSSTKTSKKKSSKPAATATAS
jgi:F420-0:gamma-glutamyl ligase-like protein